MLNKIAASVATITLIVTPAYASPSNTTSAKATNSVAPLNYTINGKLSLITSSGLGSDSECRGQRGYDDIYGGQQILVKNGKGEVIAVGSLGIGVRDEQYPSISCDLPIIVNNVPDSDFYQIEVGSGKRGSLTYSKKDLEEKGWSVNFILSDS